MRSQPVFRTAMALLIVSASIVAQSFALASTVDDEIQVGMEAYQQHDFKTALKYLTLGEHAEPQNALVHYYRANTLTSLHQVKDALSEYRKAYQLSPTSDIGFYSEQALKNSVDGSAHHPLKGSAQSSQTTPSMAFWTPSSAAKQSSAGTWASSSSPPAGVQILEQSRALSQQVVDQGAVNEANIISAGNQKVLQMRYAMSLQLGRMQNAMVPSSNGTGTMVHLYSRQDMERYAQSMQAQINAQMSNERYEAQNQHRMLQQKAEAVNQAAADLQSQLNAPYVPGQPHLSAVGTNLYVRTYDETPSSPSATFAAPSASTPATLQGEHAQALTLSSLKAQDRASLSPEHRLSSN